MRSRSKRSRGLAAALLCLLALVAWGRTRLPALHAFETSTEPSDFQQGPIFLSAAVGGVRPIGWFSKDQVGIFRERGGTVPASGTDIRSIPEAGEPTVLTRVDPGFCWLLALGRSMGIPLSLVGVARLQVAVDFLCFALTFSLSWRLSGAIAAALATLAYGLTSATVSTPFLVAYYFWSVPLALVIAHLGLSVLEAPTATRRMFWFGVALAVEGCAIWLRVAWLLVFLVALPFLLAREKGRRLALVVCGSLLGIAISYSSLVGRASQNDVGGGVLHPRSQLWHTLYIGLGAYGTWGQIQWLDEYAYKEAAAQGIYPGDAANYEAFFKARFLGEISKHPIKYVVLVLRRMADYAGEAPAHMPLLKSLPRFVFGGLLLAGCFFLLKPGGPPGIRFVAALFVAQVVTWAMLVPPVVPYALECIGLSGVVLAAAVGKMSAGLALRIRSDGAGRPDPSCS